MQGFLLGVLLNISILFISAFLEEFIFRFTIFRFLRHKGFFFSVIASSLLFALLHLDSPISFMSALVSGILLAIYYEYCNSILRVTLIHLLHNTIIVGLVYGAILPLLGK